MYSNNSIRVAARASRTIRSRKLATTTQPPPPPPVADKPSGSNTFLYLGGAAAALGGLYYYNYGTDTSKAKADTERVKAKGKELGDAVKDRGQDALKDGENKAADTKVVIFHNTSAIH